MTMDSLVEKQFYDYLLTLGFPAETIVFEPAFQAIGRERKYRPDFALIDQRTNEPLVLFEVKGRSDAQALNRGLQQVQEYIRATADKSLRGYLVTPGSGNEPFHFYTTDETGTPKLLSASFLQPASLITARRSEKKENLEGEKRETIDQFKAICFLAAGISGAVALADFICSRYGVTVLTAERLALLAASIALVVIPYLQTFKALGIEIERATQKNDG
jgi:hypothetical protein